MIEKCNVTVTHCNAIEEEEEKNKKKKENKNRKDILPQINYAAHVKMSELEYEKLIKEYGEPLIIDKIDDLNNWKGSKGKSTKSDYLTIKAWIKKDKYETSKTYPNNKGTPKNVQSGLDLLEKLKREEAAGIEEN